MRAPDSLAAKIHADARSAGFRLDERQAAVVDALASSEESVYLSGPAGRGKTWIADAFFRHAPTVRKRRVHFHAFLDELHRAVFARQEALRERRLAEPLEAPSASAPVTITASPGSDEDVLERAAAPDPVGEALTDVAGDAELLVFDEFHVIDPGDATLLTRLLEHAVARGIRVVATSNDAPGDLLPDPVWHRVIEPGIRLIAETMRHEVLDGGVDYRETSSATAGFAGGSWLAEAPCAVPDGFPFLTVRDRLFQVVSATDDELWITFEQLCVEPTAAIEFLDWARRFPRWVVLGVPGFDEVPLPARQRFVTAVDVLVDVDVPTIFVSDVSLDDFCEAALAHAGTSRLVSRLRLLGGRSAALG